MGLDAEPGGRLLAERAVRLRRQQQRLLEPLEGEPLARGAQLSQQVGGLAGEAGLLVTVVAGARRMPCLVIAEVQDVVPVRRVRSIEQGRFESLALSLRGHIAGGREG